VFLPSTPGNRYYTPLPAGASLKSASNGHLSKKFETSTILMLIKISISVLFLFVPARKTRIGHLGLEKIQESI
jgi:hypothetical protein